MKGVKAQIEVEDTRLLELIYIEATLTLLDNSSQHTEGPIYVPADDSLIWSDVKGDRLLKLHPCEAQGKVSILREKSGYQNGNALDLQGRIVACSHGDRAIVRQEYSGEWHILVDRYQGKRLNSPNDLVVKSDGTIWFTDPPFGITQPEEGCEGEQEQPGSFVFRFDPETAEIDAVITEMTRPNGLVFNPQETLLYVSDTSAYEDPSLYHDIRVYEVVGDRFVANGQIFAVVDPGQPDGICVDEHGNLFTSCAEGILVYTPEGSYLGKVRVPEVCANLTFGGRRRDRLFITAGKSLYCINLRTSGVA